MPKVFGSSLVAVLAATIVFYMVGFMIFAVLFSEQWLALVEMTEADAIARNEELGAMMFVWGLAITIAQVLGLAWVLDQASADDVGSAIKIGVVLALLIALPVLGYNWLYEGRAAGAIGIDLGHMLVGYTLVCAILGYFRSRG